MKNAKLSQTLSIGITLFSMFFGAGNLIFSPWLGARAAGSAPWALAGFLVSAVVFPICAVLVISLYKDAVNMVSTVHPVFARLFISLIYLLIGPCIAIPRTASTSREMMLWFLPDTGINTVLYVVVFFLLCMAAALRPGKLKDILGRIMGPVLVGLVVLLCAGIFFFPAAGGQVQAPYNALPFLDGFLDGYQTMDILAAFCFGIVILLNIRQAGIQDPAAQRSLLKKSAVVAGGLLAGLYSLLTLASMHIAGDLQMLPNGALMLQAMATLEFGLYGQVIISLIFFLACFNVCSGLLSCCSEYFYELTGKGSYVAWLAGFTAAGALVACTGLDAILAWSGPMLSWICPAAVLLLVWGLARKTLFVKK